MFGPDDTPTGNIAVIDAATKTVVGDPIPLTAYGLPVFSPDSAHAYVSSVAPNPDGTISGRLLVIDAATDTFEPIAVGGIPAVVGVSPRRHAALRHGVRDIQGSTAGSTDLIMIDTSPNTVIGQAVPLDSPGAVIVIDSDGGRLSLAVL